MGKSSRGSWPLWAAAAIHWLPLPGLPLILALLGRGSLRTSRALLLAGRTLMPAERDQTLRR